MHAVVSLAKEGSVNSVVIYLAPDLCSAASSCLADASVKITTTTNRA